MATNPTPPVLTSATGIDYALKEIQDKLLGGTGLSWLDNAYGRAKRRPETLNDKTIIYPSVYVGNNEYLKLFPDTYLGNFSFFVVDDGEEIISQSRKNKEIKSNFSLIFWFNFETVYTSETADGYTVENVKEQVSDFFNANIFPNSKFVWENVYNDGKNIYKGFTDKEIDNQFLMRPYGGFRLEGTIIYFEKPKAPC